MSRPGVICSFVAIITNLKRSFSIPVGERKRKSPSHSSREALITRRIIGIALATLLLCFLVPGVAQADTVFGFEYSGGTFTQIWHSGAYSGPGTGGGTLAVGVNDNGQAVGYYQSSNTIAIPYEHGYLLAHKTFTDLNYPAAQLVSTQPFGINDHNQIVGRYTVSTAPYQHGFLYSQGIYRTIDFPGATDSWLRGINDVGQMIGFYFSNTNSNGSSFLLSDGRFFTLPLDAVYGINDRSEVVGVIDNYNVGVLYNFMNGTYSTIAYPGALFTTPLGINDHGQIVGDYSVCTSTLVTGQCFTASVHGFLLNGDTYSTIDYPGGANYYTQLNGISNNGTIVGLTESRVSPVPEPSTFMMLGAGLLPVIGVIRRRYLNR